MSETIELVDPIIVELPRGIKTNVGGVEKTLKVFEISEPTYGAVKRTMNMEPAKQPEALIEYCAESVDDPATKLTPERLDMLLQSEVNLLADTVAKVMGNEDRPE